MTSGHREPRDGGRAVSGRPAASGDGAIRPRAEAARARGGGCGGSGVGQSVLESAKEGIAVGERREAPLVGAAAAARRGRPRRGQERAPQRVAAPCRGDDGGSRSLSRRPHKICRRPPTLQPLQLPGLVEPSPRLRADESKTSPYLPPSLVEPPPCTANCSGRGADDGACYSSTAGRARRARRRRRVADGQLLGHGTCAAHQRQCVCDEFGAASALAEPVEGCPSGCSSAGRCVGGRVRVRRRARGRRLLAAPAALRGVARALRRDRARRVRSRRRVRVHDGVARRGVRDPGAAVPVGLRRRRRPRRVDHTAGRCACAAGWRGADCAERIPPLPGWAIALIATLTVVVLAAAALGGFVAYAMRVNKRRLRDVVAGRWRAVEEEGWKAEAVEGMMPGARFERYYG